MDTLDDIVELISPTTEAPKPRPKNTRVAIAELALRDAMDAEVQKAFLATTKFAAVIIVPSEQWISPVQLALGHLSHLPSSFPRTITKSNVAEISAEISAMLAAGKRVVGVTADPSKLSPTLLALAQFRIDVPTPTTQALAEWIRAIAPGRLPAGFLQVDVSKLDFDTLCGCLPAGVTRQEAAARIERVVSKTVHAQATTSALPLPSLESAIEYGEAREWGLGLKRDIEDVRAGKITWRDVDRGIVLYGEPGTGKTTFTKILGASCGLTTIIRSTADLFARGEGDLGAVVKAQRAMFQEAMAASPSLLVIDELNAYPNAFTLSDRGKDWWMPILMDFQLQLDSALSARDGVIVCGATNSIDEISPAWMRNGRLERAVYIGPPTVEGLANILRTQLGDDLPESDVISLAKAGHGATAADAMDWVRSARRAARIRDRAMTISDIMDRIRPKEEWPADDKWRIAIHEAGHAVVGMMLGRDLTGVTIVPQRGYGGAAMFNEPVSMVITRQQIEDSVVCGLAGRAAEIVLLGGPSAGAGGAETSDLAAATRQLAQMRVSLGLGDDLTWRGSINDAAAYARRDPAIAGAIESDLRRLQQVAIEMVNTPRRPVEMVARALVQQRSLTGADVAVLLLSGHRQTVSPLAA